MRCAVREIRVAGDTQGVRIKLSGSEKVVSGLKLKIIYNKQ